MSEYMKIKTVFEAKYLTCLAKALATLEPQWAGKVEVYEGQGDLLKTYLASDQRGLRANLIVRRQYVGGASNDIGFAARPDGTVEAVIGDYDRGAGHYKDRHAKYGDAWLASLTQHYQFAKLEAQAAEKGLDLVRTQNEDGSWRCKMTKKNRAAALAGRAW